MTSCAHALPAHLKPDHEPKSNDGRWILPCFYVFERKRNKPCPYCGIPILTKKARLAVVEAWKAI